MSKPSYADRAIGVTFTAPNALLSFVPSVADSLAKRYQNSHQGRLKHAERQRRYRERLRKKVTHHSSQVTPNPVSMQTSKNPLSSSTLEVDPVTSRRIYCQFCHTECSKFIRQESLSFLRERRKAIIEARKAEKYWARRTV
jgi:hypothetical protein